MSELQRELELLRADVEFPATPDIAATVGQRLGRPARRRPRAPRRLALALVAALVLLAALTAAVPSARDAVLDLFGLDGATVEIRPELPSSETAPDLRLGERSSLGAAREAADYHVLVPAALGPPDGVFLNRAAPGGEVSLSYRDGRLLVSQFRGDRDPDYVGKIASQATTVHRLEGAVWIEGAPHFFFYRTPDGGLREDTLRLAGNVLLVERGELLVRIEGARSERRALEIADSLR